MQVISTHEAEQLRQLEKVVERGQKTFIEVGNALRTIRNGMLYRSTHNTFAKYVEERFGFKRANAYHLISAAEVADELSDKSDKITTATQAAAIAKAPQGRRVEVVERAAVLADATGKKPTAATYKAVVDEIRSEQLAGTDGEGEVYEDVPDGDDEEVRPAPPQSRGVGVQRAHEAIAILKTIPLNDGLHDRAFEIVGDWIKHNKPKSWQ